MWVLLDNLDSFSAILHQYLLALHEPCLMLRKDQTSLAAIQQLKPQRIILSPGPQSPYEAQLCMTLIAYYHDKIPILGVCLGHQAIGVFSKALLQHNPKPMHGKTSRLETLSHPLFEGIPEPIEVMRYHSLCISLAPGQQTLKALAYAQDDKVLMAFEHQKYPMLGLQFHPESIGTPWGFKLLENWANMKF